MPVSPFAPPAPPAELSAPCVASCQLSLVWALHHPHCSGVSRSLSAVCQHFVAGCWGHHSPPGRPVSSRAHLCPQRVGAELHRPAHQTGRHLCCLVRTERISWIQLLRTDCAAGCSCWRCWCSSAARACFTPPPSPPAVTPCRPPPLADDFRPGLLSAAEDFWSTVLPFPLAVCRGGASRRWSRPDLRGIAACSLRSAFRVSVSSCASVGC